MGRCFKLFGKSRNNQEIVDSTGSAFFVAEHYLLTCEHLVRAVSPGDVLIIRYGKTDYKAELVEIAKDWDFALLHTEYSAQEEWIYPLDRVAVKGREAVAYGYPHGYGLDEERGLQIGSELDDGVAILTNANGVTIGFSGGPVCPASDPDTAIGVLCMIKRQDEYSRQTEVAGFVPAHFALDLWGGKYGLIEKRYKIRTDVFGSNSFVYSAQKTAFQDYHDYLGLLRKFLEDDKPVLWMAIVGPGGTGKSRLCYELAHSLNSNWRCELLRAGQFKKDYLQKLYEDAGRSFLLIADYAYTDTDELGDWLVECSHAQNRQSIRVLLLQREAGRENFGWQESLLRRHRNLIELRYQEDLQLTALRREDTIAIMRSYAENMGGGQIDASALYDVLQNVDPGLTRPLFAMFIIDADLHGEDPREWDPEKALAYFTRREKDVVDRALNRPEDVHAAKLLLLLATIANGFTFNANLLDEKPLCELWEFNELLEKDLLGSRLKNARLADWEHGNYIVKPLKPDLLGEYYVLESFREMMNDPQRKETISILLHAARKADINATDDFLLRLFTDYETDEILARLCCGEDNLFQDAVSWGLVMRPDAGLLRELYMIYGTRFWLVQLAKGLFNAFNDQADQEKAGALLEELRELHREQPGNDEVSIQLAKTLFNAFLDQFKSDKASYLIDELRELHREQPGNDEVSIQLAKGLFNALGDQPDPEKTDAMLEELRELHREQPGNEEVTVLLANGLFNAIKNQPEPERAGALLEELRKLHREQPRNDEIALVLVLSLFNAFGDQPDPEKTDAMLEELRELHREQLGNEDAAVVLASGLVNAINNQPDSEKTDAMLEELRELRREQSGDEKVTGLLAKGLVNAVINQLDPEKTDALLEELRKLHREHPGNEEVTGLLAKGLGNAVINQLDPEKAGVLLEKLRKLHREQPGNDEIGGVLAWSLVNAFGDRPDPEKTDALLEELRELHREQPRNDEVSIQLAKGLVNAINNRPAPEKIDALLEELRELHREQPGNDEIGGVLARCLFNASGDQPDSEKYDVLLEELRKLHREKTGNSKISIQFAKDLIITFAYEPDQEKAGALLYELLELHREQSGNTKFRELLVEDLFNGFYNSSEPEKDGALLDELRELHREQPGNSEISIQLAKGLFNAFGDQPDPKKTDALLGELRELHREQPGNNEISIQRVICLIIAFFLQTDIEKASVILNELRELVGV